MACNDWLRMGPSRSLVGLFELYTSGDAVNPPAKKLDTIRRWSGTFLWAERAAEYDLTLEAEKDALARMVMRKGLAAPFERVMVLGRVAAYLLGQFEEEGEDEGEDRPNVWVEDSKTVAGRAVQVRKFNAGLIEQLRRSLDDIAKETGGRRQLVDTSLLKIDMETLTDEQLEQIAGGADPLAVLASARTGGVDASGTEQGEDGTPAPGVAE